MLIIKILINLFKILGYFCGFESLNSPLKSEAEIFSVKIDNVSDFSSEENPGLLRHQSGSNYLGILLFTLVVVTFVLYTSQIDNLSDIFYNIPEKGVEKSLPPFKSNSVILKSLDYYQNVFNPENFSQQQAEEKLRDECFDWYASATLDDLMGRGRPFPGGPRKPTIPVYNDGLIHDAI